MFKNNAKEIVSVHSTLTRAHPSMYQESPPTIIIWIIIPFFSELYSFLKFNIISLNSVYFRHRPPPTVCIVFFNYCPLVKRISSSHVLIGRPCLLYSLLVTITCLIQLFLLHRSIWATQPHFWGSIRSSLLVTFVLFLLYDYLIMSLSITPDIFLSIVR